MHMYVEAHFMECVSLPIEISYVAIHFMTVSINTLSHRNMRFLSITLQWRHNGCDCVSKHQPCDYLLNCLFRHRSNKTSKLHVTGLCVWNSEVTGEFPAQKASNAENVSIWWRHHDQQYNVCPLRYQMTVSYSYWIQNNYNSTKYHTVMCNHWTVTIQNT